MTLDDFQSLRQWHLRHWRAHPVERQAWDAVLTLWLLGWIGGAVSLVLGIEGLQLLCLAMLFLPGGYVALRWRLHRRGRLRCDWLQALGPRRR